MVARSDYQANSGSINAVEVNGPDTYAMAEVARWEPDGVYTFYDMPMPEEGQEELDPIPREGDGNPPSRFKQNGITFQASQITMAKITDGVSLTYCVGEKHLLPTQYTNGLSLGDSFSLYVGHDSDMNGYTSYSPDLLFQPTWDQNTPEPVMEDAEFWTFGSAHPGSFNMVMCDGSVRSISYDIDGKVHMALGGRNDGLAVDISSF